MQICNPIELDCSVCFESKIICGETINIAAGLTPAANLFVWVTDKFNNQYRIPVTIHGDGSFDISASLLPDGMFNIFAGSFDIFISSDIDGVVVVPMVFDSKNYNCLKLKIILGNLQTDDGVDIQTDDGINIIVD